MHQGASGNPEACWGIDLRAGTQRHLHAVVQFHLTDSAWCGSIHWQSAKHARRYSFQIDSKAHRYAALRQPTNACQRYRVFSRSGLILGWAKKKVGAANRIRMRRHSGRTLPPKANVSGIELVGTACPWRGTHHEPEHGTVEKVDFTRLPRLCTNLEKQS